MNKLDIDYTNLLKDILINGVNKNDRTGTGTISLFGKQIRHKMKDGFPLLTTKKMPFKVIVTELLWFLNGDTNIKYLVDNGCNIWNGDCYKHYLNNYKPDDENEPDWMRPESDFQCLPEEEFINKIKTDSKFAKKWGELGPVYGKQWRAWSTMGKNQEMNTMFTIEENMKMNSIDQIQNAINLLKTDPDSRRNIVNAWNVGELDQMVLPPCHNFFQFYTRELSFEERLKLETDNEDFIDDITSKDWPIGVKQIAEETLNEKNVPTRAISLMWNQRSVDTFLGLPFNIASYALLLEIIGKIVNMVPEELIGNLGDTHLYSNHVNQAIQQIGVNLSLDEYIKLYNPETWEKVVKLRAEKHVAIKLENYQEAANIKHLEKEVLGLIEDIDIETREPFDLPKLVFDFNNEELIGDVLKQLSPKSFKLDGYKSHAEIKAPLSN